MALRDFGRYRRAGINLGIGTDTYPHNMIEEMRHVGYLARLMAQTPRAVTTGEVFHAATVGGRSGLIWFAWARRMSSRRSWTTSLRVARVMRFRTRFPFIHPSSTEPCQRPLGSL